MGVLEAIILGLVQGLTEYLPISSTAHIRILPELFGWKDPGASFTAMIQLGTLVAILIYFRDDLLKTIIAWTRSFGNREMSRSPEGVLGWAIFLGTIPIVVCGFLFKDFIENDLRSLYVIASSLIGMGILLWISEIVGKQKRGMEEIRLRDGIWVGIWQTISLIPGSSRSGSTITGGLFFGLDRATAAKFSFLLSVPSILAAAIFSFLKHYHQISGEMLPAVVIANIASFVSGYWAISFLIKFLQSRGTLPFVIYRVTLGVLLLFLLQQGILKP